MNQSHEIRVDPETSDRRRLSDIIGAIVENLQNIFREEIRLAGSELKQKVQTGKKAAIFLCGAAGMAFFAAACFIATCIAALALVLPVWLSTLIMAVLLAAGAGGAFVLGRTALEDVDPVPQQTVETMKDNIDWLRSRVS